MAVLITIMQINICYPEHSELMVHLGFGENNKYGVFPSVSVGWILSEENFMKNITNNPFTLVKIRGSYGATGNEDLKNSYVQYNNYLVNNGGFSGERWTPLHTMALLL